MSHWFCCRLCDAKVKFTKDAISGHLRLSHNIDLAAYEAHYMEEVDWPGGEPDEDEDWRGGQSPNSLVIAETEARPVTVEPAAVKDPWNRCQFQCALCTDAVFSDRRNVKSHIVMQHKLSYQDYVEQYGDPEVPTAKWVCEECGSETRHARNNIYIHLRDCHSLTCEQYAARHGMPGTDRRPEGRGLGWAGGRAGPGAVQASPPVQLESTQFSSKWNKCKFQCPLCPKLSNEKRHIRSHTLAAHATSLDMLEAEHGDCETHTEYFFCAVCHAEVKHCHRNILMHLQRSHSLTTAEYEAKYGEVEAGSGGSTQHLEETASFGQHFLITDQGGNLLAGPGSGAGSGAGTGKKRGPSLTGRAVRGEGAVVCEDCGRRFSTLSNKERHRREHCANMQLAARAGHGAATTIKAEVLEEVAGVGPGHTKEEELRCPLPDCRQEFVRSVHLKRHLTSAHNIRNPLNTAEIEQAVRDTEDRIAEEEAAAVVEMEKVPPLVIKLQPAPAEPDSSEVTARHGIADISSAEDTDDDAGQVEIIDEKSFAAAEADASDDPLPVPIGIIINESSESPAGSVEEDNHSDVLAANSIQSSTLS